MEARDYVLALKQNGMTQVQIEERTGIPQPTISKIERGDVADVMSKTYRALKAAYDEVTAVESAPEVRDEMVKELVINVSQGAA